MNKSYTSLIILLFTSLTLFYIPTILGMERKYEKQVKCFYEKKSRILPQSFSHSSGNLTVIQIPKDIMINHITPKLKNLPSEDINNLRLTCKYFAQQFAQNPSAWYFMPNNIQKLYGVISAKNEQTLSIQRDIWSFVPTDIILNKIYQIYKQTRKRLVFCKMVLDNKLKDAKWILYNSNPKTNITGRICLTPNKNMMHVLDGLYLINSYTLLLTKNNHYQKMLELIKSQSQIDEGIDKQNEEIKDFSILHCLMSIHFNDVENLSSQRLPIIDYELNRLLFACIEADAEDCFIYLINQREHINTQDETEPFYIYFMDAVKNNLAKIARYMIENKFYEINKLRYENSYFYCDNKSDKCCTLLDHMQSLKTKPYIISLLKNLNAKTTEEINAEKNALSYNL